jgi:geranylgeranyl diphosphate synthase type II
MTAVSRVERVLQSVVAGIDRPGCPPRLRDAIRYAVFPGGARIRPRLCLSVAEACGDDRPAAADAAAAAIELLHCASLVHDDMPCFDDAELRRGKPSVHRAFDERIAVLTGDAMIVLAFQALARGTATVPTRSPLLHDIIAGAVGMPFGIVAGQAWECEPAADLGAYHRAKTGSLFAAATAAGAAAAGHDGESWRALGENLGEAYQVADDIQDVAGKTEDLGKPVGRDRTLGRPNAVAASGLEGALRQLRGLVEQAIAAIPDCPGAAVLKAHILSESGRLLPKGLSQRAA